MIGFYVHHHGKGHFSRTAAIAENLANNAVIFTSLDISASDLCGARIVHLGLDAESGDDDADPAARGALHWAPERSRLLRQRSKAMTEAFSDLDVNVLVCDVSVEAALLARLSGVSVISVRSHGNRTDRAHQLGYDISAGLLAPYPVELECALTPAAVRSRTFYSGFVTATRPRPGVEVSAIRSELGINPKQNLLFVCAGAGGHTLDLGELDAAARDLPDWTVAVAGVEPRNGRHSRLVQLGWRSDVSAWMKASTVVATHGGANLVAEAAIAARPLICVAETRPFGEQESRVRCLGELGAAVALQAWPSAAAWPKVLREARALSTEPLGALASIDGASRAAAWLDDHYERIGSGS